MRKKLILGALSIFVVVGGVATLSAFEAHVINVTARIENALSVTPDHILFGTVFPQEEIDKNVKITLSESFMLEERVDDVKYIIRQKPKPRPVAIDEYFEGNIVHARHWCYDNWVWPEDVDKLLPGDYYEKCYFNLCPYLSKHPDLTECEGNDGELDAFHPMGIDVQGRLSKKEEDTEDVWTIDLKVPCFEGSCDQGYFDWVTNINPEADPHDYMLDPELEHEMFGCDLWIEVTEVSRSNTIGIYKEADDYPDGDPDNVLGPRIGTLSYKVDGGNLTGTIIIDTPEGQAWIENDHNYTVVLNGPRTGTLGPLGTNAKLANAACDTGSMWDGGWWSNRTLDNTGVTDGNCDGVDDTDGTPLTWMEGYWNFEGGILGSALESGKAFSISLPAGPYNEVQFLLKDENTGWNTVGEYPGAGEIDGLTSYFDFTI